MSGSFWANAVESPDLRISSRKVPTLADDNYICGAVNFPPHGDSMDCVSTTFNMFGIDMPPEITISAARWLVGTYTQHSSSEPEVLRRMTVDVMKPNAYSPILGCLTMATSLKAREFWSGKAITMISHCTKTLI